MSPAESVVSRIGSDIFALLVPGSFILTTLVVAGITGVSAVMGMDPFTAVIAINSVLVSQWPAVFVLAVSAYLTGQAVHAVPVNLADKICRWAFKRFQRRKWNVELFGSRFPYFNLLKLVHENLVAVHPSVPKIQLPDDPLPLHTIFNYWKLTVCREEPALFAFVQHREARVRLYAGMFWSGASGCLIATIFAFVSDCAHLRSEWTAILIAYSLISALVLAIFGLQLRRVRGQEVESLFVSYLQVIEKRSLAIQAVMPAVPEQTVDHNPRDA